MFTKRKQSIAREYAMVHGNVVVRTIIGAISTLVAIAVLALIVWNMFTFVMPEGSWISFVDGASMDPTLHHRQVLFTDTNNPLGRGDIVTSYFPNNEVKRNPQHMGVIVVKRVIGIPGDRIEIEPDGVYLNGTKLEESYLTYEAAMATYIEGKCNSVLLDEGEYFLMGDNRAASNDSRFFGVVTADKILYVQSTKPTSNFYIKLLIILAAFAIDIFVYTLIEFVLTECAFEILYGKKAKLSQNNNNKNNKSV